MRHEPEPGRFRLACQENVIGTYHLALPWPIERRAVDMYLVEEAVGPIRGFDRFKNDGLSDLPDGKLFSQLAR